MLADTLPGNAADATTSRQDAGDSGTGDLCLDENGVTPVIGGRALAQTATARFWDAASRGYFEVHLSDEDGAELPVAAVALVLGAGEWSVLARGAQHAPTFAFGDQSDQGLQVSALAQLGGAGAREEIAAIASAPDCLSPNYVVELRSVHIHAAEAIARSAIGPWLEGPCQEGGSPTACAIVEEVRALSAPWPQGIVAPTTTYGAPGQASDLVGDLESATQQSCDGLGGLLLGWLAAAEPHPLQVRGQAVLRRFEAALGRLESDAPEDPEAASAQLRGGLSALARVQWMLRSGSVDIYGPSAARFNAANSFMAAAGAVKTYARGKGIVLDFEAPYRGLLIDGSTPNPTGLAYRASQRTASQLGLGDGLDCALLVASELSLAQGPGIDVETGIERMLDVLEAGAHIIETEVWPGVVDGGLDAGPPKDLGLLDAAVDMGVEPDAAVEPDVAVEPDDAVEPDAAVDAGPEPDQGPVDPCGADEHEPNEDWRPLAADNARRPLGGASLAATLPPGDEDYYVFNVNLVNFNVGASLSGRPACGDVNQELCLELYFYSWINAEGLLDDDLVDFAGPACGDLAQGINWVGPRAIGGVAGEAWASIVARVYRRDGGEVPAAYQLDFTH